MGGGSHASRLAEAISSINPEVIDLSIGGWKVSENNASDLANDISEAIENADAVEDCTIILILFNSNLYKGGDKTLQRDPEKIDSAYHSVGELQLISDEQFKAVFETAIPIFRAAKGDLIVGPLASYSIHKCCKEPGHVTNSEDPSLR